MIYFIPFIIVLILIIVKQFVKPNKKQDAEYDESNYVVYENTTHENQSSMRYSYKNSTSPKNMSLGQAIYTLVFAIIWNSMLIFMISTALKATNRKLSFMFIPFIAIGIFLLVISIKAIINKINKNNNSTKTNYSNSNHSSNNITTSTDEYFVKYCNGCGESLDKDDKFCPSCGKKIE